LLRAKGPELLAPGGKNRKIKRRRAIISPPQTQYNHHPFPFSFQVAELWFADKIVVDLHGPASGYAFPGTVFSSAYSFYKQG
jgi:hypothetical protein